VSQVEVMEQPTELVWVPVAQLVVGASFRERGVCPDHVDQLVALGGSWPPIVVMRGSGLVVDGAHRVVAARRLGLARVEAVPFDGTVEDAFVEFVRRNVAHGLLLTLPERKRAATRVLRAHGSWSDRRIAALCGLSPKTVGRLRVDGRCPTEEDRQWDAVRVGRDDRARPARRGSVRGRVVEALQAQPTASLRAIAAAVGVSPETVRLVRLNLAEMSVPVEAAMAPTATEPASWRADDALVSSEQGEDFLAWFERTAVAGPDLARAAAVPLSRVYELADVARRRAQTWMQLARLLEARAKKEQPLLAGGVLQRA
jgi:hypothetical protein